MGSNNGAVVLGRELRVRITPQHKTSLDGLAKMHGWQSPTALAESLLADAIERAATNTFAAKLSAVMATAWTGRATPSDAPEG